VRPAGGGRGHAGRRGHWRSGMQGGIGCRHGPPVQGQRGHRLAGRLRCGALGTAAGWLRRRAGYGDDGYGERDDSGEKPSDRD
jgi:hypothetical protein